MLGLAWPADGRPVRVGAGMAGRGLGLRGDSMARSWRREPRVEGERSRAVAPSGASPAALSQRQWDSRAAPVTASPRPGRPGESFRCGGLGRNGKGLSPSRPPASGEDRSYKPTAKSEGGWGWFNEHGPRRLHGSVRRPKRGITLQEDHRSRMRESRVRRGGGWETGPPGGAGAAHY